MILANAVVHLLSVAGNSADGVEYDLGVASTVLLTYSSACTYADVMDQVVSEQGSADVNLLRATTG